jgi:hypothetical protein
VIDEYKLNHSWQALDFWLRVMGKGDFKWENLGK